MPDPTRNQLIALAILTIGVVAIVAAAVVSEVLIRSGSC